MQLDERKKVILKAIIQNYLETGEPVGSRTISKLTDLNLSSATIRNEMSDLEEMGLIVQPHTSAGRIPSDKGYRLYVDTILEDRINEVEEMKEMLVEKTDKVESLLQNVVKMLASNTEYTSMITTPKYRSRKLKFVQLTDVDEHSLLVVIMIEGNIVKNKIIKTPETVDKEVALKLNLILNTFLQGLDLSEINISLIRKMKEQAGEYTTIVSDVLDAVEQAISEEDDVRIYTSGANNIFKYPELSDMDKAGGLINALEEKRELESLISDGDENGKIRVYIGEETSVEAMKDCSVVTATYEIDDGVYGKIGIIGPKRMDYEKVVGSLKTIMTQLDGIFKNGDKE